MVIRYYIDSFYPLILYGISDSFLCHFIAVILNGYQMNSQQLGRVFYSRISQRVCSQLISTFQQCAQ